MELILTLILAASATAVVGPSGVELERIIDNSVLLPGMTAEFLFDGIAPVPCGEGVLFYAVENTLDPRQGAYFATSEGVEIVVDEDTRAPGSTQTFGGTAHMTCVGNRFVFLGAGNQFAGVFRWSRGGFIELIQESDINVDGRFVDAYFQLSANRHGVAMHAHLAPAIAGDVLVVKYYNAEPLIVADSATVLPGQTEPVTIYSLPFMVGRDLYFRARTFLNVGLYRWSEGQGISIVADHQTAVPSSVGTFFSYGLMTLISEGLVFGATYSEGLGIFIVKGGQIEPLVVPGDLTEGGETITGAYFPNGAGGLLSFTARTVEHPLESVYARTHDGKLRRIFGTGDVIEGSRIVVINAGADASSVAIRVNSVNPNTEIIYRARFFDPAAEIPALSGLGVVVLAVGLVLAGLLLLGRLKGGIRID